MLHDVIHPPDQQPPPEPVSSPLSADQILEFCESELFKETIQNSDVASASNCCYEEQSSYVNNISFPSDMIKYPPPATTATTDTSHRNFAIMFDEKNIENNFSTPQDFGEYPFSHQDQFDLSLLENQIQLGTDGPMIPYHHHHPNDQNDVVSMMGVCDNECMSMPPSKCMRLNNNPNSSPNNHCNFLDPPGYLSSRSSNAMLSIENCGMFNGSLSFGNEIQVHELDFNGDNGGIFFPDPLPRPYNPNDLQALSNESHHLGNNGGGGCNHHPLAPPEITSMESESFKSSKLTSEERKEKIHRYMKKRNERNFSKKIKYACRKTLADSRPRVRGRFAKNDDFGEHHRNSTCNTHDQEDTDEDVKSMHVRTKMNMVKEEDNNKMESSSSDIFAHISGLNSFRCNYSIQSWI